jgi:hypothetical protein
MIRLRRWYVPGGFVLLTALALCSRHEPEQSWAADKSDEKKANKTDETEWVIDRSLHLTPRAAPVPALKYRLFPLALELKEGNAVPIYLRLVHERNDETRRQWEKAAQWSRLPPDELPIRKARNFFKSNRYMMQQLDLGARRKTAEWNYTLDAGDPIGLLVPDIQTMRVYGGLLALKARVEIASGDYAAAAYTLQTGFAFSRHASNGPFLITSLVGVAIASQISDALLDWVGRDGAPNLYWSLSSLPRPLIEMRKQLEFEQGVVELQFPVLGDLKRARTPAEWDAALKEFRTELKRLMPLADGEEDKKSPRFPPLPRRGPTDPAAQSPELPTAREYLVKHLHLPAAQVKMMPPAQVLLLHVAGVNDEYRDDLFKGAHLPVTEALPIFQAALRRMKAAPDTEATRLPHLLLPGIHNVVLAANRLERRIDALRVVEAVRLYAAAHQGRLPDSLADITEVPVPRDQGTGKPFQYRRTKETATLIAPALKLRFPGKARVAETGLRYRLTTTR